MNFETLEGMEGGQTREEELKERLNKMDKNELEIYESGLENKKEELGETMKDSELQSRILKETITKKKEIADVFSEEPA